MVRCAALRGGADQHRPCAVVHGRPLLRGDEDGSGLPNFVTVLPAPQLCAPRLQARFGLPIMRSCMVDVSYRCSHIARGALLSLSDALGGVLHCQADSSHHMQVCHFAYRTQPPHPLFLPRLTLARRDLLVLACSGGLLTMYVSLRVRTPAVYLQFMPDGMERRVSYISASKNMVLRVHLVPCARISCLPEACDAGRLVHADSWEHLSSEPGPVSGHRCDSGAATGTAGRTFSQSHCK